MKQNIADELLGKVTEDYNKISEDFSATRQSAWFEFEIYKEMISQKDKVLDVGCGNGRLFDFLQELNFEYTGIDVSENLLNIAKEKFTDRPAKFKQGGFLTVPFSKKMFDKIFAVASFHHIPSKAYRKLALQNLKTVLKKNGYLVISVWNLWQPKYRAEIARSLFRVHKYDFGDCFIKWSKSGVLRYYHAFSLFEMRNLLRSAGFAVVDELYVNQKGFVENFLEAENFIFVARLYE